MIEERSPQAHNPLTSLLASGALALAGSLWGTGFYFGKIAFAEMSVLQDVTWRFIFGSLILVPFAFRGSRFSRSDLGLLLLAGIIGIPIQFLVQFKGLELTTVSHASLMVATLPMLLAISSVILLDEHLTNLEWLALFVSAAGAMLIALSSRHSTSGPHSSLKGDLLVLLSMVASAGMMLITKRLMTRHPPLQITSIMIVMGTLVLLICAAVSSEGLQYRFSIKVWWAAAAQGVLATAGAYLLWNWGMARVPVSRSGVFLNFEPIIGAVLGITLLNERLGISAIAGGIMIVGSAIYFSRRSAAG